MLPYKEKIDWANAELQKFKISGYSDSLGGHVETLNQKLSRHEREKARAVQKLRTYMPANNHIYYNHRWVLMSCISAVKKSLESLTDKDREFIIDLYIEPIGLRKVMKKYKINNESNMYRKANATLRKVL